ncbi:hypothetical protein IJT17_02260 [bacterium]|nr:hypothetical protein [bacterium]
MSEAAAAEQNLRFQQSGEAFAALRKIFIRDFPEKGSAYCPRVPIAVKLLLEGFRSLRERSRDAYGVRGGLALI